MPLNNEITVQTQTTRAIAEELEIAICQAEGIVVSDSLQLAIDSIPFQIAAAEAEGLGSVTLFVLTEGEHFTVPEHIEPYKSERPDREWLYGEAAVVFRYCAEAGLLPSLAPYAQPLSSSLKSALVIDWTGTALGDCGSIVGGCAGLNSSSLKTSRVRVPYPEQADIRKRVARVLSAAPQLLHNARLAIAKHQHKALLLSLEVSQLSAEPLELEADFKLFCDLVHLQASCKTTSVPVGDGFARQFTVMYNIR